MSLTAICTTSGLAAAQNAKSLGLQLTLSTFKLGASHGYTPLQSQTALQGAIVYTASVSGAYIVTTDSSLVLICTVAPSAGPFNFGEIGVYTDSGTLFAVAVFSDNQVKVPSDTNTNSTFTFNLHIALAQAATTLTISNQVINIDWSHVLNIPTTRDGYPLQKTSATTGNFGVTTGTGASYLFSPNLLPTALAEYQVFDVKFHTNSLDNATITIGSFPVVSLLKRGPTGNYVRLSAGDLKTNDRYQLIMMSTVEALVRDLKVIQSVTADAASSSSFKTQSLTGVASAFGAVSPSGEVQLRSDPTNNRRGLYSVTGSMWLGYYDGTTNLWSGVASTAIAANSVTFSTKTASADNEVASIRATATNYFIEMFAYPPGAGSLGGVTGLSVNGETVVRKAPGQSAYFAGYASSAISAQQSLFSTPPAPSSDTSQLRALGSDSTSMSSLVAIGGGQGASANLVGMRLVQLNLQGTKVYDGYPIKKSLADAQVVFTGQLAGNADTATSAANALGVGQSLRTYTQSQRNFDLWYSNNDRTIVVTVTANAVGNGSACYFQVEENGVTTVDLLFNIEQAGEYAGFSSVSLTIPAGNLIRYRVRTVGSVVWGGWVELR